jgi:DNA polymerase-3 subunit gamma/tau
VSYQVLARKWRPRSFDEVAGQSHVTISLRNAIRSGRVPHAILLTGPRGVGKTTLARLLARSLNCDKGPTDAPCGSCPSCVEIANGHSTDVQEIDAASRTSVDDVRELIESARYAAAPGKHRIFVVDEVHMLSTPAFNALLKTLEEPPPRTLFVFATTNPEKIPFTVLSRCQRYDLRRLPTAEVTARLREIASSEGIRISDASLLAIAREGEGSLRDSMTLLDQVIASGGDAVDDGRVADLLDLIDRRLLLAIAEACVNGDPARALTACARAGEAAIDAKRLGGALLRLIRDLVVLRVAPDAPGLVEGGEAELGELRALAARADAGRLRRMFRALLAEQEDLAWAPEPFAVLEMAAVRLATLPASDEVGRLLARLDALETKLGGAGDSRGGGGSGSGPTAADGARPPARRNDARSRPDPEGSGSAKLQSDREPPAGDRVEPARTPQLEATNGPPEAANGVVLDRLLARARDRDRGLYAALQGLRLAECAPGRLRLVAPLRFAADRLRARITALEELAASTFGEPTRVVIESEEAPQGDAPAVDADAERRARQQALAHPAVNAAVDILRGEIVEIRPLAPPPGGGRS